MKPPVFDGFEFLRHGTPAAGEYVLACGSNGPQEPWKWTPVNRSPDDIYWVYDRLEQTTRTTRVTVMPDKGCHIYDDRNFHVEIDDDGAGEFVTVTNDRGKIGVTSKEWPALKSAIERMLSECTQ